MGGFIVDDVLSALEYKQNEGLVTEDVYDNRFHSWREARDKMKVDAVLFREEVPLVYFKGIKKSVDEVSAEYFIELHRDFWNHNRVPLLIVVLIDEVRVYNCFAPPIHPSTPGHPSGKNDILLKRAIADTIDALKEEMADYYCRNLLSGQLVRDNAHRFDKDQRVDSRLLDNLKKVRHKLLRADLQGSAADNLEESVANSLLGRSIFVRYLEDRNVLGRSQYEKFRTGSSFFELLRNSYHDTYELFGWLSEQFNGDLFPISDKERQQVKIEHLHVLESFLKGEDVESGQLYFWAYNFKYIPIELISSIYEIFLDSSKSRKDGVYYTPPKIVDFVLSQLIPFDTYGEDTKILDPACGSGIFLVEAFRRLVNHQRFARSGEELEFSEISDLLTSSIYGVDKDADAIQVAAFSCYLTLLDFLKSEKILGQVRFPKLRDKNLFVDNFLNKEAEFNNHTYSIIVGNPPWGRIKGEGDKHTQEYISYSDCPPASKQIALVFLWRVSEFLANGGKACLLAPCKGMLFNQSTRQFRRRFFEKSKVTRIVNFSRFRMHLFGRSVSPMAAVFYEENPERNYDYDVEHIALHPSPLSESMSGFVVYSDDINRIRASQVVDHPFLWKTLLWGSSRDHILIGDLKERFPALGDVGRDMSWVIKCGATLNGSDKNRAPELNDLPYVRAKKIKSFRVLSDQNEKIGKEEFHRTGDRRVYDGPHILIGGVSSGYISAVFLPHDAVFNNTVFGIADPERKASNVLKVVCAYLNSSLAGYYHFLTSSGWGIERDDILLAEHKMFPCALPLEDKTLFDEIVNLVDRIQGSGFQDEWRPELDNLVYSAYGMTQSERDIIEDFRAITMAQFYSNSMHSVAFNSSSIEDLRTYAKSFNEVFSRMTGRGICLSAIIYDRYSARRASDNLNPQSQSFQAISFRIDPTEGSPSKSDMIIEADPEVDDLLNDLEQYVTERESESFYRRKNFRVYGDYTIDVVKPAERRFWTRSAAYNDADDAIVELLSHPFGQQYR